MKTSHKIIAGLAVLLVLALTNPGQEDYTAWVKTQAYEKTRNEGVKALADIFAGPMVALTTKRSNFLFFSVFDSALSQDKSKKTLGILTRFIPLGG